MADEALVCDCCNEQTSVASIQDDGRAICLRCSVAGHAHVAEGAEPQIQMQGQGMETIRPVHLADDGLLWLINREVFHPRGYYLGVTEQGMLLLVGDGSQPVKFGDDVDEQDLFERAKRIMP